LAGIKESALIVSFDGIEKNLTQEWRSAVLLYVLLWHRSCCIRRR